MDQANETKPNPNDPLLLQQVATAQRDITYPSFLGRLRNRDDTLITRGGGRGLLIYDDIERDCHAFAVLQKRKLAVIARQWDVTPASDAPLDKQAADVVKRQLTALNFDQVCLDLLDALLKGYSVGEVMWAVEGAELVVKKSIARDQRRFIFNDEYRLRMLTLDNLIDGEELPERKFIVHTYGAKDASPYGLGLGTRLFWPVLFKRQDIIFWLTFSDKFGSPTAVGKYPAGTEQSQITILLNALQAIAQDSGIAIPEGMMIEFLEATRGGSGDNYEKLAKYMDDQISEAVLGETMSTSAKSAGIGSSQAAVHNEVRLELVKADADLLSGTLNESLVRWIAEFNVPGAAFPKVWRKVEEPKDLDSQATRDKQIFDMGYKPTLAYIVETYGGEYTEIPPPKVPPATGALGLRLVGKAAAANPAFAEAIAALLKDPVLVETAQLVETAAPDLAAMIAAITREVNQASDMAILQRRLVEMYGGLDTETLANVMAAAYALAELKGMADAKGME